MTKAIVKGETHLSEKDKEAIMGFELSDFDAVFREGHKKNFGDDFSLMFALFAIGHLVYGATYGRFYISTEVIEKKVNDQSIPFHNTIDANVRETYEMVPRWKRGVLLIFSPVLSLFILGILASIPILIIKALAPEWAYFVQIVTVIGMLAIFSFAWALAYFLLIEGRIMNDRDEWMAEEIIRITNEESYESILITCGEAHRLGIADYLRENGWEVKEQKTDSPIGNILIWKNKLLARMPNFRKAFKRLASRLGT